MLSVEINLINQSKHESALVLEVLAWVERAVSS